ncbi:MAG TPA: methionyl-tRNA formyltransferase [Ferruginibacter sp.]|nr:methionyl-tRNA formyltransferase [Ferruginibacter sp.]HRP50127.1 methionyl-tRNA formyltransferase [Ferruginibacter sp.]
MRIIFMGTPEFAATSLKALTDGGFNVVAVVTAPDKPAGRGLQLQQSAVKKLALEHQIPVLQPEKLKDPAFLETLRAFKADIQVVVAFRMLPEVVWNMPPMGTINVHGSLLPDYRGAAPIHHAVMNGESTTGVTTFKLKHEIDTGDILLQDTLSIAADETTGSVHDRMMVAGAHLLVQTLDRLLEGSIQPTAQPMQSGKHAPKIHTEDCKLNFESTAREVHNRVRGLSPYPGAFTMLGGKTLKIFRTSLTVIPSEKAGNISTDGKTYFRIHCHDVQLEVLELQLEGKKKMPVADFLRGYRFTESLVG